MGDVVVVGAGPVGLTVAALLGRLGVSVVVLERHRAPFGLPRAVHLDGDAVRVLQAAGIGGRFRAISRGMPGLRLVAPDGSVLAEFAREATGAAPESSMFHQPDLERLLLDEVGDRVRWGVTVTGIGPRGVRTDAGDIDADYVLACDGADSFVRRHLGITHRTLGRPQEWMVVDAQGEWDVWGGVHQVCDRKRPATYMRVTGDRYRWEFRVNGLPRATPWAGGEVVRAATYTFRSRVARQWRSGRVFLLGDAAHEGPPFVGQGLGSGLRDAHNLAWKLALVLRGGDPAVLDTYQSERLPQAVGTIRAAQLVGWALGAGPVRRGVIRTVARVPGVAAAAGRLPSPALARSALVGRARLAGRMCPQWSTPDGWTDDLLGDRPRVIDLDSPYQDWLRAHGVSAALVRPDRVVADTARSTSDIARLRAAAAALG
ncbi:FAD-dependent monooxygenase [Actinokineospora globicatena]|uniref:FAD-dependent monooxygenase n=1 Tax=Actinokineospora globicatena TaxID=103729 RepID=UPI0020A3586D|nr:FAD-dependent monooxygenase [Actinokineospora globicatena]MCP2306892.1 3-(3-hydroxy-phenyl)propionate hydroxylase [Actinokineospora globicatena]GLW82335.1 3-(3-hydroxyphenyl)propionate hydroxylase [Actinokineospora globicatena]GLW89072.1 3-(3-hydroxyphenyl)propionate hydroxylase [Actinokineospora globicatena]